MTILFKLRKLALDAAAHVWCDILESSPRFHERVAMEEYRRAMEAHARTKRLQEVTRARYFPATSSLMAMSKPFKCNDPNCTVCKRAEGEAN